MDFLWWKLKLKDSTRSVNKSLYAYIDLLHVVMTTRGRTVTCQK